MIDADLEERARENVELRHKLPFWKKLVRVAAKIAKAVPIYQPTLGAVGSGLDQVTYLDEQSPVETISFVLNLVEDNLFDPGKEGMRIVALNVRSMRTHFEGADPDILSSASFELKFTHSGLSKLMRNGETYRFNHYQSADVTPINWTSLYNVLRPEDAILFTEPTVASVSLLATLLALNGDSNSDTLLKYSRPSAWADIHVESQFFAAL